MKKLFLFTLIGIFGLSLILGCSGSNKEGGTIIGKVNDTFHGGGVEGAKVMLTSDGSELTTTTDSSGNFTFSDLSPGTYGIMVTKDGFFDNKVGGIKVEEGKETEFEIGMIVAFGGT
ncbi:MAG: carboxypeptidase-like regulatory domain-containing protein [bacterium]